MVQTAMVLTASETMKQITNELLYLIYFKIHLANAHMTRLTTTSWVMKIFKNASTDYNWQHCTIYSLSSFSIEEMRHRVRSTSDFKTNGTISWGYNQQTAFWHHLRLNISMHTSHFSVENSSTIVNQSIHTINSMRETNHRHYFIVSVST